jgi:hypothetical protein
MGILANGYLYCTLAQAAEASQMYLYHPIGLGHFQAHLKVEEDDNRKDLAHKLFE